MSHVCPTPTRFVFTVEGPIVAKGRPRFSGRGGMVRTYTPARTKDAERRVVEAWLAAGSPTAAAGCALDVTIEAQLARPAGHVLQSGELSAAGRRVPHPTKRPDLDNVAKLVLDALNGRAYVDDALVCRLSTQKSYGGCDLLRIRVVCFCGRETASA